MEFHGWNAMDPYEIHRVPKISQNSMDFILDHVVITSLLRFTSSVWLAGWKNHPLTAMARKNKNRNPCKCSCGCGRTPGCRRIECSGCGRHVCPGYCIAIDELDVIEQGARYSYSLCRRCLSNCSIHVISCDGEPSWPAATLQQLIETYIIFTFLHCVERHSRCNTDEWAQRWRDEQSKVVYEQSIVIFHDCTRLGLLQFHDKTMTAQE